MIMIILNTIVLGLKWYGMSPVLLVWTERLNLFFQVVFTIEAVMKLMAFGFSYFQT